MPDGSDDLQTLIGPDRRRLRLPGWQATVVVSMVMFITVGLVVLVPKEAPDVDLTALGFADEAIPATVESVANAPCSYSADLTCHQVAFDLGDGGAPVVQEFSEGEGQPSFEVGDAVFINVTEFDDGTVSYQYADRDRRALVGGVVLLFALAVVALARIRGLFALFGLTASVIVLLLFIVPAIVAGRDAVLVALVGGGAIALISLYVTHGPNPLTHVAAIGSFGALAITVALSWIVLLLARFSGFAGEEAFYLTAVPGIDLSGLLLAGIVLGTIGALDDVTVTQASTVWELRSANEQLGSAELFAAGLRVGRDHIASTVNTLLLAYAGAAMPLLILFSLSGMRMGFVVSSEVVAVEIVRTLVGSIGLVAAVPLTTFLAARTAIAHPGRSQVSGAEIPG
ncbi:MAG: YibE/F family protein [Acidimicrobiia bacterium]